MDLNRWKFILYEWIKTTNLIDISGSLDHVDLKEFYSKYHQKLHSDQYSQETHEIMEFLKTSFPKYELLIDPETSQIATQDYVYIISLLLYDSCVRKSHDFFQKSCRTLDAKQQISIAKFFSYVKENSENISKETICLAIKEACPAIFTKPLQFISLGSPLKTPKSHKTQTTPSKETFNEKLHELKILRAQLDSERYERNILEVEVRQNQEKNDELTKKCKILTQELQTLKTQILIHADNADNENLSPNKNYHESQMKLKLQKEINAKEDLIFDLKFEITNLNEKNEKSNEKISLIEKEMKELRKKLGECDVNILEYQNEIAMRDEKILQLEETNRELMEFINEMKNASEGSTLDFSLYASQTLGLNVSGCGESMAKGVIDLQLKEKEIEIENLIEKLKSVEIDKNKEIEDLGDHLKNLQLKNEEISMKFEEKLRENSKITSENENLRSGIESSKIMVEKLEMEVRKIYDEVAKGREEIRTANELNLVASESLRDEKLKNYELEKILENLRCEISRINVQKSEIEESLKREIENLKIDHEKLMKNLECTEKQLNDSHESLKHQSNTIKSLRDDKLMLETSHKVELMRLREKQANEIESICTSKDQILMKMKDDLKGKLKNAEMSAKMIEENYKAKMKVKNEEIALKSAKINDLTMNVENLESKIDNLEHLINKIEHEKSDLIKNVHEKREEIETITNENDKKFRAMSEKNEKLQVELAKIEEKVQGVVKELKAKNEKISKLKCEIKNSENLREKNENEVRKLKDEAEKKMSEIKRIESENEDERRESKKIIESFEEKLMKKEDEVKHLGIKLSETEEKLSENQETLAKTERKLAETEEKLSKTEQILAKTEQILSENQQTLSQTEENSTKLSENVKFLTEKLDNSEKLSLELESTISNLKSSISEKDLIIDNITLEKSLMQESKESLIRQKAIAEKEIEELKMQITQKDQKIAENNKEIEESTNKIANCEKMMENLKANLKDVSNRSEKFEKDVENLRKIILENETLIEGQHLNIDMLQDEKSKLEEKYNILKEKFDKIDDKMKLKSDENSNLKKEGEELSKKVENLANEKFEVEEKLREKIKSLEDVAKKYEENEKKLSEKSTELEQCLKNNDELRSQITVNEEILRRNLEKSKDLERNLQETENKLSETEKKLSETEEKSSIIQEKLSKNQQELLETEEKISESKQKLTKSDEIVSKLNQKVLELEHNLNQTQQKLSESEEKLSKCNQKLCEEEMKCATLEFELKSLKEEIQTATQEHARLSVDYNDLTAKFASSTQNFDNLKQQHENIKTQKIAAVQGMLKYKTEVSILHEKIQKISENVKIWQQENEIMNGEMSRAFNIACEKMREADRFKKELSDKQREIEEKSSNLEFQREELVELKTSVVKLTSTNSDLEIQLSNAKSELASKESTIAEMLGQIDELKVTYRGQIENLEIQLEANKMKSDSENSRVDELLNKLKDYAALEKQLRELEALHAREKLFNDKMNEDQKILAAKLMKARKDFEDGQKMWDEEREKFKNTLLEEKSKFEEGRKEIRLEMEGKLEKMKEKMKSLFSEEMTKKTTKYEEKIQEMRSENQSLQRKSDEHEAHIDRLTKQILAYKDLKSKFDEASRENDFMRSKLRFMEKNGGMSMSGSIGMARMPSTMPRINVAGTHMEDEAGEEFNNTYLKDLKGGSDFSLDKPEKVDLCSASVLQQRNSMYPQHMKGAYAVINLDRNVGEEEMRYGAGSVNLDDSDALLLQSQHRKKQSTSYKRPGPPTPSKNAGRLSIGGTSDVHYTNILKESVNTEKKQTPGRMMAFLSQFSKGRDESPISNRGRKNRTLTPKEIKKGFAWTIEDTDTECNDSLTTSTITRELNRMERRNEARDGNRPDLDVFESEDSEWTSEEGAEVDQIKSKRKSGMFSKLNDSIRKTRLYEEYLKKQQKRRSKNFAINRN